MKPVDQTIMHTPESGQYGDCQRACIASLLEIPVEEVPHFFESGDADEFQRLLQEFLAGKNLVQMFSTEENLADYFRRNPDCYHMIYGKTDRGTDHAVVGQGGRIVHDPHPSRDGLVGDQEDWWYAFLVPDTALSIEPKWRSQ